jgi:ABC-type uncharacterized transport system auxiliary subunit
MKKLKVFFAVLFTFFLAGCFEINEDIDIKADGSGVYSVHTDMSQLLQVMETYLGKDEMDKQMPSKNIDTTVMMKALLDTAKNITAEDKALVKDGYVHLKLNMDQKEFKSDIVIPFKSLSDLQKLYNSMNNQTLGFNQLFKGMAGKPDSASAGNDNGMPDMNQFNAIYDFQCHEGMMSRKLNAEKWKALQQSPQFAQMKEAGSAGISIPYTLTIVVPKPVKKVDNSLAKLFPDRKKVIIQYNLIEVFDHPEKFEYTIDY